LGTYNCGVAFSTDGKRLATGEGGTPVLIDVTAGKVDLSLKAQPGLAVIATFLGDGQRVAFAFDVGIVKVFSSATGQDLLPSRGHGSSVESVAVSPDGLWIASAGGPDGTARLWNAATGELRWTQDLNTKVF